MRPSVRFRAAFLLTTLLLTMLSALSSPAMLQNTCDLDSVNDYLNRGTDAYNNEEYQQAAADFSCALELDAEDLIALTMRGNSYSELEQYEDAIADYNQALEVETGVNAYLYHNIALAYYLQDDMVNAEEYLAESFESDSNYAPAYLLRGNFAYERGDYTDAITDYEEAIRLNYNSVWIPYYNHGLAQYELGNYEESVDDFDAAIQANPDDASSYLARAVSLELFAPEQALSDYVSWIDLIEESSDAESVEAPLEDLSLTMTEGQVYRYDFSGTSGQNLSAAARVTDDSELDPLLVLLDPSGKPIDADDDSGVNLDAVIPTFTLPETGLYTLVISHAGGGTDGTLSLSLLLDGEVSREFSIYELRVNDPVRIYTTAGDNLNLRSGPGLDFEIIARLSKDSEATLLEGPRKADGYAWWRIQTSDGQEGWAVERADEEQTLQPPLVIGSQATVYPLSGDRLNVREDAGRSFDIVTQLEQGTVVTLLGGPVEADDFRWWQIRTEDGLEGWAVDEADGEQTIIGLAPAVEETE